jgi:hypothetical protein
MLSGCLQNVLTFDVKSGVERNGIGHEALDNAVT